MTEPSGAVEAVARELLAQAYEEQVGEGPYPTYAKLARHGHGAFTLCSIRAIERALANPSDQEKLEGWQPIETAPKDGRDILILAHGMCIQARFEPGSWSSDTPIAPAEYDGAVWCGFDDQVNFEIEETDHGDFHGRVTHWMPLPAPPSDQEKLRCRNCGGNGWVCENHLDLPWAGSCELDIACECGAGAPCPVCRPDLQNDRIALQRIAQFGPQERPDGPYDEMGGYCSDNYGDVIHEAAHEAEWGIAQIAREYLATARPERSLP